MIKKGLIKTLIFRYVDENNLDTIHLVFENLPKIYSHLREHPHHGDVLPSELTYDEFVYWTKVGFEKAAVKASKQNMAEKIFENLKKKFNSF